MVRYFNNKLGKTKSFQGQKCNPQSNTKIFETAGYGVDQTQISTLESLPFSNIGTERIKHTDPKSMEFWDLSDCSKTFQILKSF